MTVIVYSFNKRGCEGRSRVAEIVRSSEGDVKFVPFNHDPYLDPRKYLDAYSLDRLYQAHDEGLMRMYSDFKKSIEAAGADAILVFNCPPYHPDFLRTLPVYKALYSGDDPDSTYKRNIPYLHAYDHVFFVDPAYSPDMDMTEKMRYCGMENADWLPNGICDCDRDTGETEETILKHKRDIDIVYIGNCFPQKLALLTRIKQAFGKRFKMYGFYKAKHNLYLNVVHRYGEWIRPVSFPERVKVYQRAKIGINIHWNEYGLGNERLYHLPANGVMQLCDCVQHLDRVYEVGEEVVSYSGADDLIDKLRYYLEHDAEREQIALAGYRRVMRDYQFRDVTRRAGHLIRAAIDRKSPDSATQARHALQVG